MTGDKDIGGGSIGAGVYFRTEILRRDADAQVAFDARIEDAASVAMTSTHSKDPLHGVTLEAMILALVDRLGWTEMGERVDIRCFTSDPSVASSLKFLRRTPWARAKVEALYLETLPSSER